MSKVSIIVPVYNGEKVLKRCAESLLNQDHKDIEIILVDDGSKDSSFEIISEYAEKDERIVPIHKENSGVSSTRNLAISKAKGDYIQFVDVDDWLPFDSTKLLVRALEENDCDMAIGDFYRVVDETVSRKGSIKKGGVMSLVEYADKMLLTPADFYYGVLWNKLYKKQLIDAYQIRMDETISYSEDTIFNLQYLTHVNKIAVTKSPVYYYVKTEGSLVMKNLNLQSTIKQKSTVIKYYNDFYKKILDKDEYEARKPIIYGYLLSVSTDAFSIPVIDDTKKLGEKEGFRFIPDERIASELQYGRLSENVFERILNTVALSLSLELNETKILYFMYKKGEKCTIEEICEMCRISTAAATMAIAKLVTLSYVKVKEVKLFEEGKISYEYHAHQLDKHFDKAEEDYRSLCYEGLSIDDIATYARIRKQIFANMKKAIEEN